MQTLAVVVIVGVAAFFLIRRFWRQATGKGDGGCDKCAK